MSVQITERDLVQQLAPDLLYFDSIQYVLQVRGSSRRVKEVNKRIHCCDT